MQCSLVFTSNVGCCYLWLTKTSGIRDLGTSWNFLVVNYSQQTLSHSSNQILTHFVDGKVLTFLAHPPHTSWEEEQWHPDKFYKKMHWNKWFTLRTIVAICRSHQEMDEEDRSEDHPGSGRGHDGVTSILPRPHELCMSAALASECWYSDSLTRERSQLGPVQSLEHTMGLASLSLPLLTEAPTTSESWEPNYY